MKEVKKPNPAQSALTPIANLIAVASGKGGVGKTWLSITLSAALAESGRRVLLVDGDLGLANVDVQLGLTPRLDLASVLSGEASVEEALAPVGGGVKAGGFDVLAGRSGSGALAQLGREQLVGLARTLKRLGPAYDDLILDLGAGIDQPVRLLASIAARVLVVLTDEPTSLTDAYALVKVLSMLGHPGRIEIVVNLAENLPQGRKTHKALAQACRTFLGHEPPLAGLVRRDKLVREAIRHQAPLLARYPQAQASGDVRALAERLLAEARSADMNKSHP